MLTALLAADPAAAQIASSILDAKRAIVEKEGGHQEELLFFTFWNFDNTILNGDSTEGRSDIYGKIVFKGMAQVAIEAGYSKQYPAFPKFWEDYQKLEKVDEPKAYAYAAQILAGADRDAVLSFSTRYFAETLRPYFFPAALDLIRELKRNNIAVLVLTASPRIFVQGAAPILGISTDDVYGMETVVQNGKLTDQMVLPLTTGAGKIEKIKEIVEKRRAGRKGVYVLAGIGNDNRNDMPFLEWIAFQKLPAGKPLGVIDYHIPLVPLPNMALLPLSQ